MSGYLFAYGTLRPGFAPESVAPMVDRLELVGEGFLQGLLYDLGEYPGLVLDSRSVSVIASSSRPIKRLAGAVVEPWRAGIHAFGGL